MAEDILAVVLIFGGGTLFLLAVSPIGRAIADRIRRSPAAGGGGPSPEIVSEVEELRREVADLAERVDFIERLQAKASSPRLAPPSS